MLILTNFVQVLAFIIRLFLVDFIFKTYGTRIDNDIFVSDEENQRTASTAANRHRDIDGSRVVNHVTRIIRALLIGNTMK